MLRAEWNGLDKKRIKKHSSTQQAMVQKESVYTQWNPRFGWAVLTADVRRLAVGQRKNHLKIGPTAKKYLS